MPPTNDVIYIDAQDMQGYIINRLQEQGYDINSEVLGLIDEAQYEYLEAQNVILEDD